jgi:uncharacterized protein (TIGR02145 family)
MPDGRTWFAENLNYTKDLTFNMYAHEVNGKQYNPVKDDVSAIGSYWCPGADGSAYEGDQNMCNIYGALYTWETTMMVDGKYADETKTSSAWDESWVSPHYYTGAPNLSPNADRNNGRGGTSTKGGGRGICPMGWHIPTQLEWAVMLDACEGDGRGNIFANTVVVLEGAILGDDVGKKLKSAYSCPAESLTSGCWLVDHRSSGTDAYGFSVVPAGILYQNELTFHERGTYAGFRMSSAQSAFATATVGFHFAYDHAWYQLIARTRGTSSRCLRDQ